MGSINILDATEHRVQFRADQGPMSLPLCDVGRQRVSVHIRLTACPQLADVERVGLTRPEFPRAQDVLALFVTQPEVELLNFRRGVRQVDPALGVIFERPGVDPGRGLGLGIDQGNAIDLASVGADTPERPRQGTGAGDLDTGRLHRRPQRFEPLPEIRRQVDHLSRRQLHRIEFDDPFGSVCCLPGHPHLHRVRFPVQVAHHQYRYEGPSITVMHTQPAAPTRQAALSLGIDHIDNRRETPSGLFQPAPGRDRFRIARPLDPNSAGCTSETPQSFPFLKPNTIGLMRLQPHPSRPSRLAAFDLDFDRGLECRVSLIRDPKCGASLSTGKPPDTFESTGAALFSQAQLLVEGEPVDLILENQGCRDNEGTALIAVAHLEAPLSKA